MKAFKRILVCVVAAALLLTTALASLAIEGAASVIYGDVNGDDDVNMKDVLLLRKFIAGMGGGIDEVAADVNGDDSIDMKDVLMMRKFIANLIPELPGKGDALSDEPPSKTESDPSVDEPSVDEPTSEPSIDELSVDEPTSEASGYEPVSGVSGDEPVSEVSGDQSDEDTSGETLPEGVIYDADVTGTLALAPGKTYNNTDITTALRTYKAEHGIPERFVITVTASASPEDDVYPILLGAKGAEVWPENGYEHNYRIGASGTIVGSVLGSGFTAASDTPISLYFYSESGATTLTLTHVRIEAASALPEVSTGTSVESGSDPTSGASQVSIDPGATTHTLTVALEEESPRYNTQTTGGSWVYPEGETATFTVSMYVYRATGENADKLAGIVSLTGATQQGAPVVGPQSNDPYYQSSQVSYTYTVVMDHDVTVTGTIANPTFNPATVTANGQGGGTAPTSPTSPSAPTTPTTPSSSGGNTHHYASEPTDSEKIDLVTLTVADQNYTTYGFSYHSFEALSTPVIQYVEGTVNSTAGFASAKSVSATQFTETIKEYDNYSPTYFTFDYDWSNRDKMVYDIVTYGYQAKLSIDGTNVKYGTTYSYRAGDPTKNLWSPIYTFTTRPETVGSFSFIYTADTQPELGDNQAPRGMNMLFNKAIDTAPTASFFVSGGDFVYCSDEGQGSITTWRRMINGSNANTGSAGSLFTSRPWFVANGNHDNNKVQSFFNNGLANRSEDYYSFNYGNAHIVVLDTGHSGSLSSTQLAWLENDLAANASAKWKLVFLHWPFYCHTERDLQGSSRDAITIFDRYGVDMCVSAHVNGDYYTTYPLKAGAVATTAVSVSGDTEYYTEPGGTIYLQNASSGLGGDLQTGPDVLYIGKNDGIPFSYAADGFMRDGECGNNASFMVVRVESGKLTVDRYYLDGSTVKRYVNGQFGIIK